MFKLLKATAIVSVATMANIISGLIRAKFTAVTLGPSGVGIFAQAMNFQQFAISVASLSIGLGVVKYVAVYNEEGNAGKVKETLLCGFIMQLFASLIFIAVVFLFAEK